MAADVVLEVGGALFPVRRATLAAHSAYFRALFFGGCGRERGQRRIRLRGVAAEAFAALDAFSRTGAMVAVEPRNACGLLEAADFLQFERVKRRCEAALERELRADNCLRLLAYARRFACPSLEAAARAVALSHWAQVAAADGADFAELLTAEELRELLGSDELFAPREDAVLEALLRWVAAAAAAADPDGREERAAAFPELVALVRGPCLSLACLDRLVLLAAPEGTDDEGKKDDDDAGSARRLARALARCPPPSWSSRPAAGRSHDTLFVVAGQRDQEQQELFHFQPRSGSWRACAPLRRKNLTQYAVAAVGNFLFVTGGYFREEFAWCSVAWVLIYNTWENCWLEGPAMKKARNSHCAVGVGFHLYVLGGSSEEGNILPDVERLAPADSEWQSMNQLVHPVERAGAVSVGTRIYVICGLGMNGDVCSAVQSLDVETDTWAIISFSPLPRYDLCVTALNGAIYTFGGNAFRFDIDTGEWTPVAEECLTRKFFMGCSTANGRIYLLGQRQGNAALPNMVLLDPYLDICQEVDSKLPCPLPIQGTASVRRFDMWV